MIAWTDLEVDLIVASYFEMLIKELQGESYSKAESRRNLKPLLNQRSDGSIEFKHQNISAVLIKLGQPYVRGYAPRYNYQKALEKNVIGYLKQNPLFESHIIDFVNSAISEPAFNSDTFSKILVDSPKPNFVSEPTPIYGQSPIKINYLEREQQNSKLGEVGEKFVFEYEKWRLNMLGKESFADRVIWVSKEEGDGAGYDILSKNDNGSDRYIEVKTTKLGKETPFYFSRNELQFSQQKEKDYHLFRLYDFRDNPRLFVKNGKLNEICHSVPVSYKGYF